MKFQIKHKLFFTLLLTSIVVSSGMFLFMQWSFDRGFLNYVNNQKMEDLNLLSEKLVNEYSQQGGWGALRGNERLWHQLIMATVEGTQRENSRPGGLQPPPPFPPPRDHAPRFALFSADKKPIFVPDGGTVQWIFKPLAHQGEKIGYLALAPLRELSDTGDLLFVEQQTESFALIALAMALLSILLAYPLTVHLLRPVKALAAGTRKLMAGQYKTRIPVASRDELGQLTTDFNCLAMTLEKNEQARQQWVADISHELRTPLAVLRGDIEALQDGIRSPEPETLAALHNEIMHLGRLVNDLYELSMSDIGALNYKKVAVDPIGILRSTLEQFESRFAEKKLLLRSELPVDQPVALLADPDRLQQLFTNLLENSLRYTDGPGQLRVAIKTDPGALFFCFEDSAPGVSAEQQKRLFDRLYRVDNSRNRINGGAGLGLSICSNIVAAHQGEIAVDGSELGGLKLTIKFPLLK